MNTQTGGGPKGYLIDRASNGSRYSDGLSMIPRAPERERIRVGIVVQAGVWMGGLNYLRNLVAAVLSLPEDLVMPIVFTGKRGDDLSGDFTGAMIVRTSLLDRKRPAWVIRKVIAKVTFRDLLLQRLLTANRIDVLSHSGTLAGQSSIAVVGWIPDFQHVHLPAFFSPQERAERDREFRDLCLNCDRVVVSSECAAADLRVFSPEHSGKIEVMRFVASPAPLRTAASLPELKAFYDFQEPFFLLPNQFWQHKNHAVVIRALQVLKEQGRNFTVLSTGVTSDERQPGFFAELMTLMQKCGVQDQFRVLGAIPFDHLVGLMRDTIAFINPSFFEGWSTSVEEAKSMGKCVILSDISVHREQAPGRAVFFDPSSPVSLANAMIVTAQNFDRSLDESLRQQAIENFPERQRAFGENYRRILTAALRSPLQDSASR